MSRLTELSILALSASITVSAAPLPWWDNFPRMIITSDLVTAQTYAANAAANGVANDPGWGLWFTYSADSGAADSARRQTFQAAGIASLSYNEAFGDAANPITELQWDTHQQRWTPRFHFWDWQLYGGGPIVWSGAWSWFDSFLNDPPPVSSEPSYFARPFTRLHPIYGGPPMTYPDGTIASGFFNNDASDPRNSRIYDAGASKNIFGQLQLDYGYNSNASLSNQPHAGEIWVPAAGKFAGLVTFAKDSACPAWVDYAYASSFASVNLTQAPGTWTDNLGPWDSFMSGGPIASAFGEWSIARFRAYLTNHFALGQLQTWGVLANGSTLAEIASFDVRGYFRAIASNQFGLASTDLNDGAWRNSAWIDQPIWRAYKIFKRQTGTDALAAYDEAVHTAAKHGGQSDFALLANDITPACLGWARGSFDLASTELSLGWNLAAGERGFGLPPFARVAPFYKTLREHGRSRFVGVWLYSDGYGTALTNRGPVEALFYEMLASHTLPHIAAGDSHWAGTAEVQTNFLQFVAQRAAPAFTNRQPVEEVGLYFSSSSVLTVALPGDASNFSRQDHLFGLWGWGTVLSELHYQYRIVPEWKLTRDLLRTLKVLIVPNAVVFEPTDAATLQAWVQFDGGSLIVTGDSGSRLGESGYFDAVTNLTLAGLTMVSNYATAPSSLTNRLGAGAVRFVKSNLGRSYYDATANGRASLRANLAGVLSDGFGLVGATPVLISTNAPVTVGLTLYADAGAGKSFIDLNNFNVDANSFLTTPTPVIDLEVQKPFWLGEDIPVLASAISPQGAITLDAPEASAHSVRIRLPSVTNYLSAMVWSAPTPPSVTSQPANQTVFTGGAARFAVTARGSASLTYQWRLNGTNLGGATQSVLDLASAGSTNAGVYAVLITNLYGNVSSSNATLDVRPPLQLQAPTFLANGTIQFLSANADNSPIPVDDSTNYEALASTDLIQWITLPNALLWSNSAFLFRDCTASNYPQRFYRVFQR